MTRYGPDGRVIDWDNPPAPLLPGEPLPDYPDNPNQLPIKNYATEEDPVGSFPGGYNPQGKTPHLEDGLFNRPGIGILGGWQDRNRRNSAPPRQTPQQAPNPYLQRVVPGALGRGLLEGSAWEGKESAWGDTSSEFNNLDNPFGEPIHPGAMENPELFRQLQTQLGTAGFDPRNIIGSRRGQADYFSGAEQGLGNLRGIEELQELARTGGITDEYRDLLRTRTNAPISSAFESLTRGRELGSGPRRILSSWI